MNHNLDICIITHNRKTQLIATLENIWQQAGTSANIYVLDNGSTDGTDEAIRNLKFFDNLNYIRSLENRGVCRGRNILWRLSNSELLISMDDDIILTVESIQKMVDLIERSSEVGIISPLIVNAETGSIHNPIRRERSFNTRLYEACFLVRRTVVNRVGYLDRRLIYAGEGLDYAQRVIRAGYTIERAADIEVLHYDRYRGEVEEANRRLAWMWSFAYVYAKNFPPVMSIFLVLRNCAAHVRSGFPKFGLRFVKSLPSYAFNGMRSGLAQRKLILGAPRPKVR